MWLLITGLVPLLLVSTGSGSVLAPYQVSIRSSAPPIVGQLQAPFSNDGGSVPSRHICSGIIIKDKYILTTAGCVHVREPQTGRVTRLINPGETFIVAGNLSVSGAVGTNSSIIRRNVISVIPHDSFNATSGEHDIALLKLDRPLPLQNSSVRWIELQGPPPNVTSATTSGGQTTTTTTAATASNKVNENCFINIYNNSVGPSNYPYTVVRNVSFFEKWICDERRKARAGRADGRCVEYRFSASQACLLDPDVLWHSEERGTALVCNFKLAAILAEINPPANAGQCVASAQRRSTAYYTPIEPYLGWIGEAIGNLWVAAPPPPRPSSSLPAPGGGSGSIIAGGQALAPGFVPGPAGTGSSWGTQQQAAAGIPKSAAIASFCNGTTLKVILFNLFISLTVIYRFHH